MSGIVIMGSDEEIEGDLSCRSASKCRSRFLEFNRVFLLVLEDISLISQFMKH